MTLLVSFVKKLWNSFILNLKGELVISFFVTYSVFFALFNMWRALFGLRFPFFVFLFFCALVFFMFFLFVKLPHFFYHVSILIFSDFLWRHRKVITFGITVMRDWPLVFGIYASLSLSSFYLVREYPENLGCYLFYVSCVIFRNIFLVPFLGYSFVIKVNEKKKELLSEKGCVPHLPLFSNTPLLKNEQFCCNLQNWIEKVLHLTPPPESSKRIAYVTTPTGVLWFFCLEAKNRASRIISMMSTSQKKIEGDTLPILESTDETIPHVEVLKRLAFLINEHAKLLSETVAPYQEMGSMKAGLFFALNPDKVKDFLEVSFIVSKDSLRLSSCFELKLETIESREMLVNLTKRYSPEFLPQVTQNVSAVFHHVLFL